LVPTKSFTFTRANGSEQFRQALSGLPLLPPKLEEELTALREEFKIEVQEDPNSVYLIVRDFPTTPLYSKPTTTLLLQVPRAYPDAGLDMFWTDEDLRLVKGGIPQAAEVVETHIGKQWRRFSWHPQFGGGGKWNPNLHDIRTYLAFVTKRLQSV